jgi:hypothetical protein
MKLNIWIPKKTALYVGGDPSKGQKPTITTDIESPQLLIDTETGVVAIIESVPTTPIKK